MGVAWRSCDKRETFCSGQKRDYDKQRLYIFNLFLFFFKVMQPVSSASQMAAGSFKLKGDDKTERRRRKKKR